MCSRGRVRTPGECVGYCANFLYILSRPSKEDFLDRNEDTCRYDKMFLS